MGLGINWIHDLISSCKTVAITEAQLQPGAKHSMVNTKFKTALNRLAALINLSSTEELNTDAIQKVPTRKNTEPESSRLTAA
eukprot:1147013-Pelagomonas_calceolata.AAC.2